MKAVVCCFALAAAFAVGVLAERFLTQDACLDNGGVYLNGVCFTDKTLP